ncbi:MAG: DUF4279 domain-containing protein [Clostridiales bacterium]|nr:DUF4279 domain-containing protein [Clostridiales bacterium]
MGNNCTIYAEMHMIFNNDFDVYSIKERLGIAPTACKTRKETRISPLTNKHIEGFWTLKTEEKEEWDLRVVLNELMKNISDKLLEIKNICDENNGTVVFDVVPFFDGNSKPVLYFERDFLDVVNYLNATIQIDNM